MYSGGGCVKSGRTSISNQPWMCPETPLHPSTAMRLKDIEAVRINKCLRVWVGKVLTAINSILATSGLLLVRWPCMDWGVPLLEILIDLLLKRYLFDRMG